VVFRWELLPETNFLQTRNHLQGGATGVVYTILARTSGEKATPGKRKDATLTAPMSTLLQQPGPRPRKIERPNDEVSAAGTISCDADEQLLLLNFGNVGGFDCDGLPVLKPEWRIAGPTFDAELAEWGCSKVFFVPAKVPTVGRYIGGDFGVHFSPCCVPRAILSAKRRSPKG
jgi:hypothetical protein